MYKSDSKAVKIDDGKRVDKDLWSVIIQQCIISAYAFIIKATAEVKKLYVNKWKFRSE